MTLTAEQIEICNKALLKIGSKTVTADSDNIEARLCEAFYKTSVEEVLAAHTWSCGYKQAVVLCREQDVLRRYLYPIPDDFIRLREVNRRPLIDIEYELIGKDIATNESNPVIQWQNDLYYPNTMVASDDGDFYQCNISHKAVDAVEDKPSNSVKWDEIDTGIYIHIKYVGYIEPSDFNSMFDACIICMLASNFATALSTSQQKSITLINEYKLKLIEARRIDNSQRKTLQPQGGWNKSRR